MALKQKRPLDTAKRWSSRTIAAQREEARAAMGNECGPSRASAVALSQPVPGGPSEHANLMSKAATAGPRPVNEAMSRVRP